ncbi:MAG: hypothetical protein B7Z08_03690 [Sphingomonadales bacterium 32-68-7]|nr:MAG: hypothetical protein B7Z33_02125 [Sphingomonadales bacterium 12-68-11]OYX09763.1 MAG: hypothetical protein B7Z08_03690 [Sphingomonadales bacterium 32-68-7]
MHRYDPPRRLLGYGIAALAGFVDAAGFLAADGYFVSFMSGNTTRLGVDLATRAAEAVTPVLLIAGFVVGVVAGAVAAERVPARRKSAVLALAAGLIGTAALGHALGSPVLFLAGSVLAMGAINNAFRRDGEVAVGVTYMTGALVRLGQGLAARITGKPFAGSLASLMLWASLAGGAILGAIATTRAPAAAPWIPLAGASVLLWGATRIERQQL